MKTIKILLAVAFGLSVAACAPKAALIDENGDFTSEYYKPSKAQVDSASYMFGLYLGSIYKNYDFGEMNFNEMFKGIKDFAAAKGQPYDPEFGEQFKINPDLMGEVLNGFLSNRQNYLSRKNDEDGKAFLAANAKKPGVETTASGLQYKIIEPGSDLHPGPEDTVKVNYEGRLLDGTVFDKTYSDPVSFTLNQVIAGWSEGMQLIGEGGKIQLFIPAELAYGQNGNQGIGPNSTLIFDVETVEVHPVVAAEAAE